MREIEFRGKSQNSGRWVCGDLILQKYKSRQGIHIYEKSNYGYQFVRVNKKTLGQYTGRTDKNGKKIFEGDIVDNNGTLGIVKWFNELVYDTYGSCHSGFYCYEWLLYGKELNWHNGFDECEVIGNIYDNPELLTHQHEDKGESDE